MFNILLKWTVAIAFIGGISKCAYDVASQSRFEELYTEEISEARAFLRICFKQHHGMIHIIEYPIGGWYLTCKWQEE